MTPSFAWRSNPERLKMAAEILGDARFQEMLKVAYAEHPMTNTADPKDGCDSTFRLGQIAGYQRLIGLLASLQIPNPQNQQPVQSTFEE